jgi:energy-coupling factor transport system ATP-binding protein
MGRIVHLPPTPDSGAVFDMIRIENLTYAYPDMAHPVLDNISLEISSGKLVLVTGASGSGKSTLLRCINGLVPHFTGGTITGQVHVEGQNPIQQGPQALAHDVGFVFQEPEMQFVYHCVEDEIAFVLENAGMPRKEMQLRVSNVLETLQITEIRERRISEISGGEKQLVAIASALVSLPRVLVLDEPTSQLDPTAAAEILEVILRIKSELGITILISEHRLERLLGSVDCMAHLQPGGKIDFGAPRDVLKKMNQAPPLITISRRLGISPLPLTTEEFPRDLLKNSPAKKERTGKNAIQQNKIPTIATENLSVTLKDHQILDALSLKLYPGETLALVGPNGSGKTTLLRAILGLVNSDGRRKLFGREMEKMNLPEIIQHIGYLPQNPNDLLFAESVLEELAITCKNHNQIRDSEYLLDYLSSFGLADKAQTYPRDLSVGERQRTALAAITVHHPEIVFLDEPTRGMDYENKDELAKLMKEWRDANRTILLITHDIEFAARVADRVAILEDGRLVFTGSPRIGFNRFPSYRTQTARLFPEKGWIVPSDVKTWE